MPKTRDVRRAAPKNGHPDFARWRRKARSPGARLTGCCRLVAVEIPPCPWPQPVRAPGPEPSRIGCALSNPNRRASMICKRLFLNEKMRQTAKLSTKRTITPYRDTLCAARSLPSSRTRVSSILIYVDNNQLEVRPRGSWRNEPEWKRGQREPPSERF